MLLNPFDILQPQLGLDDLHVADGVDLSFDVDDVRVVECTHNLEDTVDGSHMGQEGISKTGTGGGSLRIGSSMRTPRARAILDKTYGSQTGNINAGEESGYDAGRLVCLHQPVETFVRHWYTSFLEKSIRTW